MSESTERPRGPGPRHRSTLIADDVVTELNYRVYLLRLEPPLMPAESRERITYDRVTGKPAGTDATRRKSALSQLPMTRDFLRVAVDLGLIEPEPVGLFG